MTKGDRQRHDDVLQGLNYLKQAFGLFERLAPAGTERDKSGNRRLLYSHYAGLLLLGLFNPTLQSLRALSQVSRLKKVQKALGTKPASLGSLSESTSVFDPELLEPILQELLGTPPGRPHARATGNRTAGSIPDELARRLVAVDGSVLKILPQIVAASGQQQSDWRLHLQFDVSRGIPLKGVVAENGAGGAADERSVLARTLEANKTYITDAGYERYALFEQIVQAGSDYVCRAQRRPVEVLAQRSLSTEAQAAGILTDDEVQLGRSRSDVGAVTHRVRRIVVAAAASPGRQRTDRRRSDEIVLLTNLCDVPAEVVAAIYRMRWLIELFFRFFKHVLGCRKLISQQQNGVTIQVYCALIAALLMAQVTGQRVNRRLFELICLYFQGWADEDEVIAGVERESRKTTPGPA